MKVKKNGTEEFELDYLILSYLLICLFEVNMD